MPFLRWLATPRHVLVGNVLDRASRDMGDLNLTRAVLAMRAGRTDEQHPCDGPRFHAEPIADGRLRLVADRPPRDGATSFTVTPPWGEDGAAKPIGIAR